MTQGPGGASRRPPPPTACAAYGLGASVPRWPSRGVSCINSQDAPAPPALNSHFCFPVCEELIDAHGPHTWHPSFYCQQPPSGISRHGAQLPIVPPEPLYARLGRRSSASLSRSPRPSPHSAVFPELPNIPFKQHLTNFSPLFHTTLAPRTVCVCHLPYTSKHTRARESLGAQVGSAGHLQF